MKQYLFEVGIKDKETGEQLNLKVWAESVEKSTVKLTNSIIGYNSCYQWTGTNVLRNSKGEPITRILD